jgi:hypothetical protein
MIYYGGIGRFSKVSISPISGIKADGSVHYIDARTDKGPYGKGKGA